MMSTDVQSVIDATGAVTGHRLRYAGHVVEVESRHHHTVHRYLTYKLHHGADS